MLGDRPVPLRFPHTVGTVDRMEQIETDDWYRRLIRGRHESYIATAHDLARVVKTTRTNMAKCGMTREMLAEMLDETYVVSVHLFLQAPIGSPWYQPLRDERFSLLKAELS